MTTMYSRENLSDDINDDVNNFKVGDIVECFDTDSDSSVSIGLGLIEEIVLNPEETFGKKDGKYSIYGFKPKKDSDLLHLYFGDYRGSDLKQTGKKISIGDLQTFHLKEPDNKGLKRDMEKVIKNYGRSSGRNK